MQLGLIIGVGGGTPRHSNATVPLSIQEVVPQEVEEVCSEVEGATEKEVVVLAEERRVRDRKSGHPLAKMSSQLPSQNLDAVGAIR